MEMSLESMFGLDREEVSYLFSLEKLMVMEDIRRTKKLSDQEKKLKWLNRWVEAVNVPAEMDEENRITFINDSESLSKAISNHRRAKGSSLWYKLIMIETIAFKAYFPLGLDQEDDKEFSRLKYSFELEELIFFNNKLGILRSASLESYYNSYCESLKAADRSGAQRLVKGVILLAGVAVGAAVFASLAGPIAVGVFGAKFAGLSGAALTSAALAYAGGGAIAAGGAGMVGGAFAIAGGGALLGAVGGGMAAGAYGAFAKVSPNFAYSQMAKLSVVMREILLNEQHDILSAQKVMENLREKIANLNSELKRLELETEKDKLAINNLSKIIEGMERQYKEMNRFASSYEVGLSYE